MLIFRFLVLVISMLSVASFAPIRMSRQSSIPMTMQGDGLKIDMKGKIIFIGGVADSTGYGWAIAKAAAEAGAKVLLGTWPPVLPMFQMGLERGQFEEDAKLSDGSSLEVSKVIKKISLRIF
jgi:NAD(P)-dependent dehydrogenase (short-subunit alcohol dehydrogenase family)